MCRSHLLNIKLNIDKFTLNCVCVCVCQCQPTALFRASDSAQSVEVVYFQFMHRLGRPHYVREEYLYSVVGS